MKKRILSILLALALLCAILPATSLRASAATTSGTCGPNLTWSFDIATGTLTIQGSGKMNDYGRAPWIGLSDSIKKITIGNGVTTIGSKAFYDCGSLTSVTIPDSVTTIGSKAFYDCGSLTSVTIPDSVTSIGNRAFFYCTALTSVTIPNSVTSIGESAFVNTAIYNDNSNWNNGILYINHWLIKANSTVCNADIQEGTIGVADYAFYDCGSLTSVTIPDSVTSIGNRAFFYCTALTSVTIPNSVTSIGEDAFYGCDSLTKITVASGNPNYSSDSSGVLFNKNKTELICCPGGFSGSYTIPSSVTSIGKSAFGACTSLTSVKIPDSVTSIGEEAFFYCTALTSVTIPNSVTSIGEEAFFYCTALTSVTIPNSVTSIGNSAFSWCTSLTSATIPNSVTSIGPGPFWGCGSLTMITVASGNQFFSNDNSGVLFNKNKTDLIQFPGGFQGSYTIPDSVTSIGSNAFSSCASLTSVTIPDSVTSIGDDAFSSCTSLTSVTIPDSVTSIGNGAFWFCTALTSVTIPNSVTSIGGSVFQGCGDDLVIYGVSGSYAETYANEWNIPFVAVAPAKITTQPKNATVVAGQSATFKVVATGSNLTYQWQYKRAGDTSWSNYSGKTEATLTVKGSSTNNGCQYRCAVTNVGGTTYSNAATLTVVTVSKPTITAQPKNATAANGESATFSVTAAGEGTLTYQWQFKRSGATSWSNWSGKTAASLVVTAGSNNNGCQYRCAVTNAGGTTYSNAATLTVTVAKPTVTTKPKSVSLAAGECMTFSCAATGEGTLSYQWQYKRSGATAWSNWSGKTDTILNVVAGSNNNGCQYRCAVTNAGGTTYTNAATLTVTSSHNCPGAAFTDMPAKGTIEHTAIDWAIRSGVTNGTSATKFSPSMTVTRSQVVTFLWRACGSPEPKTTKNPFTDVKTTDWFYKAVLWAVEQGITNGTSANKFSPNTVCSRSQTLTFLYRQQGSPAVGSVTVPYTDVTAGAFYENAMKWAYSNGIDKGVTATTFAPNANCVRVSNVVFLYRAITGLGRLK